MHLIVKFKSRSADGNYNWERVADTIPKQLFTRNCPETDRKLLRKNQLYTIYFDAISQNELIGAALATEHYTTCGYWKIVGKNDWVFKRGKNKGLLVSQIASCFPHNEKELKSFIKTLASLYKKTHNVYTRNTIFQIFNSEYINYCEVFGYTKNHGSIILTGKYKNYDILTLPRSKYMEVCKWLDWAAKDFINPLTKPNCEKWIKYLDQKFQK